MTLPLPPELPLLPAPYARAFVLLWNPDAEVGDFVAVVESDPALTASVLRAANSALSASLAPVHRVREAVVRIGLMNTRQILSAAVIRAEFSRLEESGIDAEEMWRHLLVTALVAEELVGSDERRPVAFTAGLLHDVGRLALATSNAARYHRVVELARGGADVREAEQRVLGTEHAEFGRRICEAWRLPADFTEAVGKHHCAQAEGLAAVVASARDIAWRLGIGDGVGVAVVGPFEGTDAERAVIERLGGPEGIARQIRSYRDATASRH